MEWGSPPPRPQTETLFSAKICPPSSFSLLFFSFPLFSVSCEGLVNISPPLSQLTPAAATPLLSSSRTFWPQPPPPPSLPSFLPPLYASFYIRHCYHPKEEEEGGVNKMEAAAWGSVRAMRAGKEKQSWTYLKKRTYCRVMKYVFWKLKSSSWSNRNFG